MRVKLVDVLERWLIQLMIPGARTQGTKTRCSAEVGGVAVGATKRQVKKNSKKKNMKNTTKRQ